MSTQIDLATWIESDRRGLLAEVDFEDELASDSEARSIPVEFVDAAARYREEHGHFPHPRGNAREIHLCGMAATPGLTWSEEAGMGLPVELPVVAQKTLRIKIYAAKTEDGKTSILTRYFGHGISSAPAWVAV